MRAFDIDHTANFIGTLEGIQNSDGSFDITLQLTHLGGTLTRIWRDAQLGPFDLLVAKLTAAITSSVA